MSIYKDKYLIWVKSRRFRQFVRHLWVWFMGTSFVCLSLSLYSYIHWELVDGNVSSTVLTIIGVFFQNCLQGNLSANDGLFLGTLLASIGAPSITAVFFYAIIRFVPPCLFPSAETLIAWSRDDKKILKRE
jgi:hypothetical protein